MHGHWSEPLPSVVEAQAAAAAVAAVAAMSMGVVVLGVDGRIVWANPEVTRLTGWSSSQLLGGEVHDTIHQHSHRQQRPAEPCALLDVALTGVSGRDDADLFLRSDGALLPVSWVADPLSTPTGDGSPVVTGIVVRFADVTAAQMQGISDSASREQDRAALWDAQQTVSDLGWIAELTRVMSSTMDEHESLRRLARLLTPRLADICVVDVIDGAGNLQRIGGSVAAGIELDLDTILTDPALTHRIEDTVTRDTVATQAVTRLDAAAIADPSVLSAPSRRLLARLGARSMLITPLAARNRMVGVAGLIRRAEHAYTDADLLLAADIGRRAGLVLDNARLYQLEQRMAEHLQLALLPTVQQRDHLDIAARYLPAADLHRVGGDWYDVFTCPNAPADAHVLVVGDVAGHDLAAAATMAALRNLLRGVAVTRPAGPAELLASVDAALPVLDIPGTATVTVVRAERGNNGWTLTWSSAGHPPAVLIDPSGQTATLLQHRTDPLLGTGSQPARHEHTTHAPSGSTLNRPGFHAVFVLAASPVGEPVC